MECEPGQEAQVDFGTGAWIVDEDGRRRRSHVLGVVLCHSRKGYSEAVLKQTTENFIRVLENAFSSFGGVPRVLVIEYVPRNIFDLMCPSALCGLCRWDLDRSRYNRFSQDT